MLQYNNLMTGGVGLYCDVLVKWLQYRVGLIYIGISDICERCCSKSAL